MQKVHTKGLLLAVFTVICASYFLFHKKKPIAEAPLPKLVDTKVVQPETIQKIIKLIGTVKPQHNATLVAGASGILNIHVQSGQTVKKGQALASIVNTDIEKNFQLSEHAEFIAKAQYQRFLNLKRKGYFSPKELDEHKQSWISAQKEVARSRIEREKLLFSAPFDGIVGVYKQKDGAQLREGQAIVSVYDPKKLRIDLDIPCTKHPTIIEGQTVLIKGQKYSLSHYQKMLDEETHMCPSDIYFDCADCLIGSSISVELVVEKHEKTLVVPSSAVFYRDGKPILYSIKENSTELTPIKTGIEQKDRIEIIEGLTKGAQVVATGTERLYAGMTVEVAGKQTYQDKNAGN